jgi:hypothetical protein
MFGGIFPTSAMIAHDCVPNVGYFANMDELVLEIVSLTDIEANSAITLCYDCSLKVSYIELKQKYIFDYFESSKLR